MTERDWTAFVDEHGGLQAAADALGISYDAMRFRRARQRRQAEHTSPPRLGMAGFATKSVAAKHGDVWVKQTRESGELYAIPTGQRLKGVSALVDAEGREVAKWIKSEQDRAIAAFTVDVLKEALSESPRRELIPAPLIAYDEFLTDYVLGDHHLGLLAWKPESGDSYDLKIGEKLLLSKMDELVERTPPSKVAILTNLGDFFHSNNDKNETVKGTAVDVDGRFGKVLMVGVKLVIACIDRLLEKHQKVIVAWLYGNHDENAAMGILVALVLKFENNPRVEIRFNPSKFFAHQHGKTMLFATHGDTVTPKDAVEFVASQYPEMWGDTRKRYAKFGHVHHSAKGGTAGRLVWESFETLAAKDAWHAAHGYQSDRSMTAITYHNATGEWSRNRVSVA